MPFCGCLETLAPCLRARLLCSYHGWCRVLWSVLLLCVRLHTDSDPMRVEARIGSWSVIMSRGRSPSRRSRSWAPRKGYSRHRRDRERIFIICVCSQSQRHFATRPKSGTIGASEAVHFRALRPQGVEGRSTSNTQAYPWTSQGILAAHGIEEKATRTSVKLGWVMGEFGQRRCCNVSLIVIGTQIHVSFHCSFVTLRRVSIRAFGGPTYSALVTENLLVATVKTARRTGDACRLLQFQCGVLAFQSLSRGDEFIHFDETVESRHSSAVFVISSGKTKFPEVNRKQGVGCSCSWLRIFLVQPVRSCM